MEIKITCKTLGSSGLVVLARQLAIDIERRGALVREEIFDPHYGSIVITEVDENIFVEKID